MKTSFNIFPSMLDFILSALEARYCKSGPISINCEKDEDGKLPCHLIGTKRAASPWRKPGDVLGVRQRCAQDKMCARDVLEMCARQDVRSWTFLASKLSSGSLRCCVLRYNNTLVPYHFGATLFQALLRASSKST